MINVFGHRHPDSDAICSAMMAALWLSAHGKPAKAWRCGDINPETAFILHTAGVEAPPLFSGSVAGLPVWLVDFCEQEQGPEGLAAADIRGVFDHHRLGTLMTQAPLEAWIKPLGSCATVIWQVMCHEAPMTLSVSEATLMLGAILSDTVALTSPTTTQADIDAVTALFARTTLDREQFIANLLAAKTDLVGYTPMQLLQKDIKNYVINGQSVAVAQLEIASDDQFTALRPQLLQVLRNTPDAPLTVLMVTNIMTRVTTLYFSRPLVNIAEPVILLDTLSRKKEVLPWITHHLPHAITATTGDRLCTPTTIC